MTKTRHRYEIWRDSVHEPPLGWRHAFDLECRVGFERVFVEVTTMVGSAERRRVPLRGLDREEVLGEAEDRGGDLDPPDSRANPTKGEAINRLW